MALAGLGRTEKALFREAGVLPTRDLRDHYEAGGVAAMDDRSAQAVLSQLDPRSRRSLEAILLLAREHSISSADLDVLLRVARQMAKK